MADQESNQTRNTEHPWYPAAIWRREWPVVRNNPAASILCLFIGAALMYFLFTWFIIPGKNASIEAKQGQIEQLNFVKDLASSLTNAYQSLDTNLKNIASTTSNSTATINYYNGQITALHLELKDFRNSKSNLEAQLAYRLDEKQLPNFLADWSRSEFREKKYGSSLAFIELCYNSQDAIWNKRKFDATLAVIRACDIYCQDQSLTAKNQFERDLNDLINKNFTNPDELQDVDATIAFVVPFMPISEKRFMEDCYQTTQRKLKKFSQ